MDNLGLFIERLSPNITFYRNMCMHSSGTKYKNETGEGFGKAGVGEHHLNSWIQSECLLCQFIKYTFARSLW